MQRIAYNNSGNTLLNTENDYSETTERLPGNNAEENEDYANKSFNGYDTQTFSNSPSLYILVLFSEFLSYTSGSLHQFAFSTSSTLNGSMHSLLHVPNDSLRSLIHPSTPQPLNSRPSRHTQTQSEGNEVILYYQSPLFHPANLIMHFYKSP